VCIVHACEGSRVRCAVATLATVIEYQQVALSRKSLWYHVQVVLTNYPAKLLCGFAFVEVRTYTPYYLTC
jgi:hypothetical protein